MLTTIYGYLTRLYVRTKEIIWFIVANLSKLLEMDASILLECLFLYKYFMTFYYLNFLCFCVYDFYTFPFSLSEFTVLNEWETVNFVKLFLVGY